jgi:PAS domain S-box-containing protein
MVQIKGHAALGYDTKLPHIMPEPPQKPHSWAVDRAIISNLAAQAYEMPEKKEQEISFASSDTFREIFQTSAEGIIMIDDQGKILLANPVSEAMFGYAPQQLIGRSLEDLLPQRYRGRHVGYRKQFNDHPAPRRMGIGRDLQALRLDGSEFPVEISLSYTQIGGKMLSMAFITDISLRKTAEDRLKKSEEELIQYAAELEKKVQSRTEALNLSVQNLERANEETRKALEKEKELNELKSKFVSIASHEFRTPLSAILSSTSLIKQYRDRNELDKVDKHVDRIRSSVEHLTGILNDLLSLGKLEEGHIEVKKERVSIASFIHEIQEEVTPVLKERQELNINMGDRDLQLYTDTKILRGVLFNLISNASKYSDVGRKICLNAKQVNDTVTIEVQDEGIGIPSTEVKHIFDRFFRASNASNIQGTGLGLNIVKRYVELLGGRITFDTVEGKGSTFKITLPFNPNEKNTPD